ncbi:hypothetical protein BRAS3843_1180007 [Bradyrhizobium sp. STM 3843]|nr:hypothetical protein BRAS3843_1180007 [Bradyrhizobium sp. STM 3843]
MGKRWSESRVPVRRSHAIAYQTSLYSATRPNRLQAENRSSDRFPPAQ